ncbi:MAG: hemerythrin domain-containing protein [Deltaproteobacteria bacterium]|nr:hemerythrin domain-containing protein [Deltaproteobacteria bacterium]
MATSRHADKIVWSNRLVTGSANLDAEHREIVEWLGLVARSIEGEDESHGLFHASRYLRRFWDDHTEHERSMMLDRGYDPQATAAHLASHQELVVLLDSIQTAHGLGERPAATLHQIYVWLIDHIERHDAPFIAFIRSMNER